MKPTVRVSIGGLAFNLEEDAYHILNNYLDMLKKHFETNAESSEIIADIESRLSELLQMRLKNSNGVVTIDDAQEIINRMGNPKDFGDEDVDSPSNLQKHADPLKEKGNGETFKKKLYRDPDHRIIAGVCSGLGHYFRVDPVLIRILFIGVFLLFNFLEIKSAGTVILAYIIMWIVMPKAGSFSQKLAMTGADPSIENIEDRNQPNIKRYRGSSLNDLLGIVFKIMVGIVGISACLSLVSILGTMGWIYFDKDVFGADSYLSLVGLNSLNFKTATLLVISLPLITLIAFSFKLLKGSKFGRGSLTSFLIGLTLWGGAVFYLANKGISYANNHKENADMTETITVETKSDTLYVKLADEYLNASFQPQSTGILYTDKDRTRNVSILPIIQVEEDSTLTDYKVEVYKKAFGRDALMANKNLKEMHLANTSIDSLLTISPQWYTNDSPWNMEYFELKITTPVNKKVKVETPLNHDYTLKSVYWHGNCTSYINNSNFN